MRSSLALYGGQPARSRTDPPMFPGGMEIGEEEKQAVLEVLESRNLFRYYGPTRAPSKVAAFEKAFASHMDSTYALGVSSGTGALHTALVALGVGPGDEVIVPAYTFIASAAAVIAANAIPVIAEVDDSLTMDPVDLERKITPHTKAIMPVHMRGAPCDMDAIMSLAQRHDLLVIEDVAQSDGASYGGKRLGTFGDVGCFSLQYHKIITSGEGGVVLTDDKRLYDRARMFHDAAGAWRRQGDGAVEPYTGGTNYRMSELAGALALVQLGRLEQLLGLMRRNKRIIREGMAELRGVQLRRLHDPEGDAAVCLIFFVEDGEKAKLVAEALRAEGVSAGSMYDAGVPDWHIYRHWSHILNKRTATATGCPFTCPFYTGRVEYSEDMCPQTLEWLGRAVHLNISPMLTEQDAEETLLAVRKVAAALL
ncbi:MAG: DegT/DnrJ/EryC1/StrS family aminotransferase [Anaerolineae bacterium]|nr:DegT/DnrJ/EryC1/StrS family aminotransferase [Anaerolineae bacterium]